MKKLLFWMVLIVGTVVLIGSCAKKDDTTTAAADNTTTTLSAPTGLTATGGASQVALDWTALSGASSYTVYWDNATGVSSSSTAITSVSTDSYSHTGLDNGTTYYYKVAAVDSAGTGSLSSEVNATTNKYISTTTTASGSITMGDYTLSGVYASACLTSASFIASFVNANVWPSEVKAYGNVFVVTGSDNISIELYTFTDTSCSTSSMSYKTVSDNVTVGSASGSNYPVTYNNQTQAITVHTTAAETTTETLYSNTLDWTVGTPRVLSQLGQFKYGLWTLSGTTLYEGNDSTSATPTSAGTVPYVKQ
jgi:hypothetical protein